MPTVCLSGHQAAESVAELLRLFYGQARQLTDGTITAGPQEPRIDSRLDPAADDPVVHDSAGHAAMHQVRTSWPDGALSAQVLLADVRREIKRQLYQALVRISGYSFPWGSLTGIRPTHVAAQSLVRTGSQQSAARELEEHWFARPEKARLAVMTAAAEQDILAGLPPDQLLVYLGIPFCPSRCSYCSFITCDAPGHAGLLEPYVAAVIEEARLVLARLPVPVSALYIGGGTPTSLPPDLLERLLQNVLAHLPLAPGAEITVEAGRPDTIDRARLDVLQQAAVTRLCINPQTMHDRTLARIGRGHTVAAFEAAWHLARSMGFRHMNLDLIAGLPGEQPRDFLSSLHRGLSLDPESVTVHALAIKRSSSLQRQLDEGMQPDSNRDATLPQPRWEEAIGEAGDRLVQAGLKPYYLYRQKQAIGGLENTGYARSGQYSRYNVGMMSDQRAVLGLGSGAVSKAMHGGRLERLTNPRSIPVYLERVEALARRKCDFFSPAFLT